MADSTTVSTGVLLALGVALFMAAAVYPSNFRRWLQRKRYQYEVTFSLYMLTPTEKFIFNSILFLLLSLLIIAASLYLPEHVSVIANRVIYYFSGRDASLRDGAQTALKSTAQLISDAATQYLGRDAATPPPGGALAGPGRAYMDP